MNLENLIYCPLDLPPIPRGEMTLGNLHTFDLFVPDVIINRDDQRTRIGGWDFISLRSLKHNGQTLHSKLSLQLTTGDWDWTPNAKKSIPLLIKWIEQHLPFKQITTCFALSSLKKVDAHSDIPSLQVDPKSKYYYDNDPCMFRLLIDGSFINNGFFVQQGDAKTYVALPKESPGWVMSASQCLHGNDDPIKNNKILCYMMGIVDGERHQQLLADSYAKYKNYAIFSKKTVA